MGDSLPASEEPFLTLTLSGPSFAQHTLPAPALRDIADFQDLVVAVASGLWKRQHPSQGRLPAHFADRIEPRLSGMGSGSVKLLYADPSVGTPSLPPVSADEVTATTEAVDRLLDATESGIHGKIDADLPLEHTHALSRLWRSLKDEDALIVQRSTRSPINLHQKARQIFRLAVEDAVARLAPDVDRGTVGEMHALLRKHFDVLPAGVWEDAEPVIDAESGSTTQ